MDIYFYIIRKNSVHDQLNFPNSQLCHESDIELWPDGSLNLISKSEIINSWRSLHKFGEHLAKVWPDGHIARYMPIGPHQQKCGPMDNTQIRNISRY